jgi:diacylglycerol O-acyltransferase / wax synthase
MIWAMPCQRLANLFTSNLPGPAQPLYLAGARVLELFQVGVVQGNITVAAAVFSYVGQLNFTILGDADAVPDLNAFSVGKFAVGNPVTLLQPGQALVIGTWAFIL